MIDVSPRLHSDLPIPPGEVLEEELDARGMTRRDLAARLDRPSGHIDDIVGAIVPISPETAVGLERVLGIDAEFWMNLEAEYGIAMARIRDRDALQRDA